MWPEITLERVKWGVLMWHLPEAERFYRHEKFSTSIVTYLWKAKIVINIWLIVQPQSQIYVIKFTNWRTRVFMYYIPTFCGHRMTFVAGVKQVVKFMHQEQWNEHAAEEPIAKCVRLFMCCQTWRAWRVKDINDWIYLLGAKVVDETCFTDG